MGIGAIIMSAAGGLALFLFGLRMLSSALKRAIGERMKALLERLTGKAYRGVIVGAVTSGILQSSSMTMVLLIELINAGALKLAQGIGVMLGAEIGTTLTAQIVAFKIGRYYLPIIAVGFLLSEVFRGKRCGDVGRIILGFGLLFLGMNIMSGGLQGLAHSGPVLRLLESCGSNVFVGVLIGAAVTAVIQSSSAMTAIVIAMGAAGVLTLPAAIALILGANIGTTVTAQIASIGSSLSSRRLTTAQFFVNALGVAAAIPLVPWLANLVAATSTALPRQIANAHTFFNVAVSVALIPIVGLLVKIVEKLVRGKERHATAMPQYLGEEFLETPSFALSQARHELMRMAEMSATMVRACHQGLLNHSRSTITAIFEIEDSVDHLKRAIGSYLDRISVEGLSAREESVLHALQHVTGDVERVGDQAVNIGQRALASFKSGQPFSQTALEDLDMLFEQATTLYEMSICALGNEDAARAREALVLEDTVDRLEKEFKANHLRRLKEGDCRPSAGVRFVEILHNLERIGDHAANIADDVLNLQS